MSWFDEIFDWVPKDVWRNLRSALDALAETYGIPLADLRAAVKDLLKKHPDWTEQDAASYLQQNPEYARGASGVTTANGLPYALIAIAAIYMMSRGKL